MFISQAFTAGNNFAKYIAGFVILFIANQLGTVPLLIFIALKVHQNNDSFPEGNEILKYLDKNLTLFLILLTFAVTLLALLFWVKQIHKQAINTIITTRNRIDWHRVGVGFVVWALFMAVFTAAEIYFNPQDFELQFQLMPFLVLLLLSLTLLPIQTTTEELIFRGYLMQGTGLLFKNKIGPLITTSVLFGLVHLANPEIEKIGYIILVYYIGMGFFLGITTLMDQGTELAIGIHYANNFMAAILITADYSVFDTHAVFRNTADPTVGLEIFGLLILFVPFLLYFQKKYQWASFKTLLTDHYKDTPDTTQDE